MAQVRDASAPTEPMPAPREEAQHPEFGVERQHLAGVVAAIDERIKQLDVPRPKVKNWALHSAWRIKIESRNRLEKARPEPYFGRVDFRPSRADQIETHHIGRFAAPGVTDWRAPVASLMYSRARPEDGLDCYTSPDGEIAGLVSLRRHYRIERAELLSVYDARIEDQVLRALAGETPATPDGQCDPYLAARLSQSAASSMRDIVATIQAEQNEVLRAPLGQIVVLQGVAGSGKTAVALHRVAYLMYAYPDAVSPQDTLVLGPNRLLLQYVADLLPASLGVSGVNQHPLSEWLLGLLGVRSGAPLAAGDPESGSLAKWVRSPAAVGALRAWCGREGVRPRGGVAGPLLEPALKLWIEFLRAQQPRGAQWSTAGARAWLARLQRGSVHRLDLGPVCYIAERIGPWAGKRRYDHIVVDEAQDLTPLLCAVLASRSRQTSLTLVGDLAQCLDGGTPADWDEVLGRAFGRTQIARHAFRRNYRSTRQVVAFAREVLQRAETGMDLPEAVARDGPAVSTIGCPSHEAMIAGTKRLVIELAARHNGVAVVTPDEATALGLAAPLVETNLGFEAHTSARSRRRSSRVILPVDLARGLEFDSVVVVGAGADQYPATQAAGRRLYTAITRALHELAVVWSGKPSPLLPAPPRQ